MAQSPSPGGSPISLEFTALQAVVAGRFSLVRELGRGGMGIVFLARDASLERPVAIKLLPPHLSSDPTLRERFLREARTAARLMHPDIVPIHAVEEHGDLLFFVMAFVDGETLAQRVHRDGPLRADGLVRLIQELSWALAYAHAQGVVHRDIKPDNVLIERGSGRALIADFGIARGITEETLGAPGTLVGTVQYMSPEQANGDEIDGRSDLYSLGATAFFAAAGRPPFEGTSFPMLLGRLLNDPSPNLADVRSDLPPAILESVSRCLAKRPSDRFANAEHVSSAVSVALTPARTWHPTIRSFLRDLGQLRVFGVLGACTILGGAGFGLAGTFPEAALPMIGIGGVVLFFAYVLGPLGYLLQISRAEVGWDELDDALVAEAQAMDAERKALASRWARRDFVAMRVLSGFATFMGLGGGALYLYAWRDFPPPSRPPALLGMAAALFVMAGVSLVTGLRLRINQRPPRWLWGGGSWSTSSRTISVLRRVIRSALFKRLFASVGGRSSDASQAAGAALPTATLLLRRVDELYSALPIDVRDRFPDVMPVSSRLERVIHALRERISFLQSAIAEVGGDSPGREEMVRSRDDAQSRLGAAITALETLRMDLLRLQAGLAGGAGITDDLERAAVLSDAIDAELHGVQQMQRVLSEHRALRS